jgi:hypothetical protein
MTPTHSPTHTMTFTPTFTHTPHPASKLVALGTPGLDRRGRRGGHLPGPERPEPNDDIGDGASRELHLGQCGGP